jgi:rfaE bifunctional protein nucleotidyltransferase chain/domain
VNFRDKIIAWDKLPAWRKAFRATGKKLVVTNGCFDILHLGHVTYLESARNFGDALLVGVNGDEAVAAVEGRGPSGEFRKPTAPPFWPRWKASAAFAFSRKDHDKFLSAAQPDIYVKGGDYTLDTLNQDERRAVESAGGKMSSFRSCPANPRRRC